MDAIGALSELYGRLPALVGAAVEDLTPEQLRFAPAPGANPIGWLVWHLTRVQDGHVAELMDQPQVWVGGRWATDVGLAADPDNTGFGHTAAQVAEVAPRSWRTLVDYHQAVLERTVTYLRGLHADDLDRVVDRTWDPPVSLGVRLCSVVDDSLQHAGQAAYLRGLLPR